jgi:uncharacterized protein YkwD
MHKLLFFFLSGIIFLVIAGCTSTRKFSSPPGSSPSFTSIVTAQANTISTLIPSQQSSRPSKLSTSTPLPTSGLSTATLSAQTTSEPTPTLAETLRTSEPPAPTSSVVATAITTTDEKATQVETPTTSPTPSQSSSDCTDQATFEGDVTIPDNTIFHEGDTFVKTWRIYNAGTCTWGPGYQLVLAYGDPMGAAITNPLPAAAPGTSIAVSLNMTAPNGAGQHTGNWELQNASGQRFGVGSTGNDYFWAQINVSYSSPEVAPTSQMKSTSTGIQVGIQVSPTETPTTMPASSGCTYSRNPDFENQILQQINVIRTSNGLNTLTLNPQLSAAALTYSLDMACNNRVDFVRHTDSNGGRWYDRIAAQGYSYAAAFENVYVGNPTYSGGSPESAMNWWMQSPIHRANILNPDITEIGIAYVYNSSSDYGGYYTTDFATP